MSSNFIVFQVESTTTKDLCTNLCCHLLAYSYAFKYALYWTFCCKQNGNVLLHFWNKASVTFYWVKMEKLNVVFERNSRCSFWIQLTNSSLYLYKISNSILHQRYNQRSYKMILKTCLLLQIMKSNRDNLNAKLSSVLRFEYVLINFIY